MRPTDNSVAFGAPGIEPRWTSSAKEGARSLPGDLEGDGMKRGCPTGAAMPLCWSHAEYISLVRSRHGGVCFDRVEPAHQRYVVNPVSSRHEIWTPRQRLQRIPRGKILRTVLAAEATVVWLRDNWATANRLDTARKDGL